MKIVCARGLRTLTRMEMLLWTIVILLNNRIVVLIVLNNNLAYNNTTIKKSKALKAKIHCAPTHEFPAIRRESAAREAGGAFTAR